MEIDTDAFPNSVAPRRGAMSPQWKKVFPLEVARRSSQVPSRGSSATCGSSSAAARSRDSRDGEGGLRARSMSPDSVASSLASATAAAHSPAPEK